MSHQTPENTDKIIIYEYDILFSEKKHDNGFQFDGIHKEYYTTFLSFLMFNYSCEWIGAIEGTRSVQKERKID